MPPVVLFPRRYRELSWTAPSDLALLLGAVLAVLSAVIRGSLDPGPVGLAVAGVLFALAVATLVLLRRRVSRHARTYLLTAILGTAMLFTADVGGVIAGFFALVGSAWGYLETAG